MLLPALAACGSDAPTKAEIAAERLRLTNLLSEELMRRAQTTARAREASCRSQLTRAFSLLGEHLSGSTEVFSHRSMTTASLWAKSRRRWIGFREAH